jgi:glycosyltransferase involved in cell wall biosynthesis
MLKVLLIHAGKIAHYRVPIYNYLSEYLESYGFDLMVLSDGIQRDNPHRIFFNYIEKNLSTISIVNFLIRNDIDVIIDFIALRNLYLFPIYFIAKGIMRKRMIYWGQGRDLLDQHAKIKNIAYAIEQSMCDAIILYSEHLKKYLPERFHKKTFIANNTLCIEYPGLATDVTKEDILKKYGINTMKNIICMGRMQKRKRIDHIYAALKYINRSDIGLILVGPDNEGILDDIEGNNIYKLGPIYGDERFDILTVSDVYCLPGAVGLSIIDAFYCGLPFVTEEGDESAEIMYLKNGVNGFIVPRGNIKELAEKLLALLDNDNLREQFSKAAKQEIEKNGSMEQLGVGFRNALIFATKKGS